MTAHKATPRSLDPKFKDADVPEGSTQDVPESEKALATETDPTTPFDPDEKFIVHHQKSFNEKGEPVTIVHGPMPIAEYADYAREHRL